MEKRDVDTVIIGAGLTGLTAAFHLKRKGKKIIVLEKNDRIGGQIRTWHEDDFIFESGPNTGAVSHPEVAELFQYLSPACELETAHEEAKRRLIWKGDRFHELPCNPLGGLTTPLFSWYDKFRILSEPFRAKGTDPDEPVGALARRRLGKSYLDYAVDPFVSGVYSGDPMQLTTRFAFPKLYRLEQQYGGFIKGAIAKAREPKTERDRLATKKVFSAKGGLSNVVHALTEYIGRENIILSAENVRIHPREKDWNVDFSVSCGQKSIITQHVITTVGGYALPSLLPFIPAEEIAPVSDLVYAPMMQVSVGVRNIGKQSFNAFGGLIPSCEQKDILGILFPAACFENRAPKGGALFSFFIGGIKHPELLLLSDQEVEEIIVRSMHELLKFPVGKTLDMIRIFRHLKAIPQYGKDTGERLAAIRKIQNQYPGLILAGNIRDGIGMADRIKQSTFITRALD